MSHIRFAGTMGRIPGKNTRRNLYRMPVFTTPGFKSTTVEIKKTSHIFFPEQLSFRLERDRFFSTTDENKREGVQKSPETVHKLPETHKKFRRTVIKSLETYEKVRETVIKFPETHENVHTTVKKSLETHEKVHETVENSPTTLQNMPDRRRKLPVRLSVKAEIREKFPVALNGRPGNTKKSPEALENSLTIPGFLTDERENLSERDRFFPETLKFFL